MNEKTKKQIEEMKKQTFGVEVEMNNITSEEAARVAAKLFSTNEYRNTAARNGYSTWSAWDTAGREWKFQKDVSITGDEDEKCEMVTPILHYEDIEILQELIRKLRHAGAKSRGTCRLWCEQNKVKVRGTPKRYDKRLYRGAYKYQYSSST